eukprot:Em0021g235a
MRYSTQASPVSTTSGDLTSILEESENGISDHELPEEPIHIINIGICSEEQEHETDSILARKCSNFVQSKKQLLNEKGIRRITFLLFKEHSFPKYFTFRARSGFEEDTIYRHLEPALAFQLEINRLSNFDIRALPCQNHRMHLYLGSAKVAAGQAVTDHRFFIRTIIRHSDFVSREASYEYLEREGEKTFLECLDQLEVAFANLEGKKTDCNHIFLNFVPPVILDPRKVADKMLSLVSQYGVRLLKMRVTEAEVKTTIKLTPTAGIYPCASF